MSAPPPPTLNLESLAMSASLFTAAIDSWIPASFGKRKTDAERAQELNEALLSASVEAKNDRLGLGHPDLGKPKTASGTGLSTLHQRLQGKSKAKQRTDDSAKSPVATEDDSDSDSGDNDSRIRAIGKVKRKADPFDPLRNKKAKQATAQHQPGRSMSNLLDAPDRLRLVMGSTTDDGLLKSSAIREPLSASGKLPPSSPSAGLAPKAPVVTSPVSPSASSRIPDALLNGNRASLSKNQKSKARKKRAKLAQMAASTES